MTAMDWNKYLPHRWLSLARAMRVARSSGIAVAKAGAAFVQSRLYAQLLSICEIVVALLCIAAHQWADAAMAGLIALGLVLQIRTRTVVLRGNGVTTITELDWETLQAIAKVQKQQRKDA